MTEWLRGTLDAVETDGLDRSALGVALVTLAESEPNAPGVVGVRLAVEAIDGLRECRPW